MNFTNFVSRKFHTFLKKRFTETESKPNLKLSLFVNKSESKQIISGITRSQTIMLLN